MGGTISNLVNSLAEGIHGIKCRQDRIKNVKFVEPKTKIVSAVLNIRTLKIS